ncbi:MAG: LamG domain-containing protein [Verrucomicrobiales bacterium]
MNRSRRCRASVVTFGTGANVDPVTGTPLTVEAWVRPESNDGAVVAHGGPQNGYAIYLQGGKPRFAVRSDNALGEIGADAALAAGWTHLAATVDLDRTMKLYVNGELAAEDKAPALLAENPKQPLDIGADSGSAVAEYESPFAYRGLIDEVRVYHAALTAAEIKARAEDPSADPGTAPAVASAFTGGKAESAVQGGAKGEAANTERVPGKLGDALKFAGMPNAGKGKGKGKGSANANKKPGDAGKSSFQVEMNWAEDVPLFPQGMALAGDTIFIAGAPDLIDEEETFARITRRDESVDALLAQQDAALRGEQGSILMAVSKADSEEKGRLQLPTLPVWDGMAAANGKLFVAGKDGKVYCLGE